jgi:hypothetical protein
MLSLGASEREGLKSRTLCISAPDIHHTARSLVHYESRGLSIQFEVILKLLWRVARKTRWGMTVIQDLLSKLHDKGWTWEAIAEGVEVDYSTVYKWRVGIQTPSNGRLVRKVMEQLLRRERIPKRKRYTQKRTAGVPKG